MLMTEHGLGDALYVKDKSSVKEFTLEMDGGLGNKLFKLAGGLTVSSQTNRKLVFPKNYQGGYPHSSEYYFDTIFRNLKFEQPSCSTYVKVDDIDSYTYENWTERLHDKNYPIEIHNYFQNWMYIPSTFCDMLHFNTDIVLKYPNIQNRIFIHIRGGDYKYINLPNMDNYYQKALCEFPEDTEYVIFTNDIPFALTKKWLPKNHIFINESEVDTLYLMSKCKGGIAVNSTFSWWGAYLNPNRKLILPSHYFSTEKRGTGFHFPGATVIEI
jgi:hypothetical protein